MGCIYTSRGQEMDAEEQKPESSTQTQSDINASGRIISGGMAAIDYAILIQLLPEMKNFSGIEYGFFWVSVLILSICMPVITFVFGCYTVMPRNNDASNLPIKYMLFAGCIFSVVAISMMVGVFHFFAGVTFFLITALVFFLECLLEFRQHKNP